MIVGELNTEIAAAQLKLLFDIEAIFKRRGRLVSSYEDVTQLLFDPTTYGASEHYYPLFHSSAFRRVIGFAANSQRAMAFDEILAGCPGLGAERIKAILDQATDLSLLKHQASAYLPSNPVGFGPTFEWYVAAVCHEELASIAYWGVEVRSLPNDYDVVLVRENQVGYIECKSGKLGNITAKDIQNFFERERALSPHFSIYLVDGVSRESIGTLVEYALEQKPEYEYQMLGGPCMGVSLEAEEYRNFVRLTPTNTFFVPSRSSIITTLREVYEFLTLVCDRGPFENTAAKEKFKQKGQEVSV
jgi:hypothetical protein